MNTTRTSPANPVPALTPLAQSLLADWDDPDLSELDLARRHGLTLDQLAAHAAAPAFQHALALCRTIRESRRPLIIARAEANAAQRLTALTARDPASATAAKEVRLAIKALLALLAAPTSVASPGLPGEVSRRSRDGGGLGTADGPWHSQEPPPPPLRSGTSPGSPGEANAIASPAPARARFKPRRKPVSR